VGRELEKDVMNEADEEHHVARVLIAELDRRSDDHRDAKFTVLAESVRHHIKEEEGEMLSKAKGWGSTSKPWAGRSSRGRRSFSATAFRPMPNTRWSLRRMEGAIRPQQGRVGAVKRLLCPQSGRAGLSHRLHAVPGAAQRPRGDGARRNSSSID
jgi:hypothetical protein